MPGDKGVAVEAWLAGSACPGFFAAGDDGAQGTLHPVQMHGHGLRRVLVIVIACITTIVVLHLAGAGEVVVPGHRRPMSRLHPWEGTGGGAA